MELTDDRGDGHAFRGESFFAQHYIETLFVHVGPLGAKGKIFIPSQRSLTDPRRCSMEFLHSEFHGGSDDVVLVTLDGQANVMLLDDSNFLPIEMVGLHLLWRVGHESPVRLILPMAAIGMSSWILEATPGQ